MHLWCAAYVHICVTDQILSGGRFCTWCKHIHRVAQNKWERGHLRLRYCRFNAFKLCLFILPMTSHDVICMSDFVLFNNIIIFVVLFGKTAKMLLSIMMWVEEKKRQFNSSYEFAQRQNLVLADHRVSFEINTDTWLVSLYCLNTLIMMKSATEMWYQTWGHLHAIIEQVEEMLMTTCHIVIKTLVKFTL